jgi:hypothetical protein
MRIKIVLIAFLSTLIVLLPACDARHHRGKHVVQKKHEKKPVDVYVFPNGSYYYNDDGIWWIYTMSSDSTSTSRPITNSGLASGSGRISIPSGGTWSRAANAPSDKEIQEADKEQAELDVDEEGQPVDENAVETEETADEATGDESADTADTETDAADTGDTGGDVGGDAGGDFGGDAGGGDGGGAD